MSKTKSLISRLDDIIKDMDFLAGHTSDAHVIKALNNAKQSRDYLLWFDKAEKNAEVRHN